MPTSSEPAIAVIQRKRTAACPSHKNTLKSAAIDLQMTVIPGEGLRTGRSRSKGKRDHTPFSLQEK